MSTATTEVGRRLAAMRIAAPAAFVARVRKALQDAQGNRSHAAKALGVRYETLARWLRMDSSIAIGCPPAKHGQRPGDAWVGRIGDK